MSLFHHLPIPRADLPFAREDANRFLPWIIGIMTVLTALALSAGLALSTLMVAEVHDFDQRYQIHVPVTDGSEKATAEKIAATLPKQQGIVRVQLMDDKEIAALLTPWLGTSVAIELLPVPRLIDVWVSPEPLNAQAAKDALAALPTEFPGVQVEHFATWVEKFNATARNVQLVIYGIALLMLLATVTIIILVTKTSVQLHFDIVKLLHRIGARDHYISRQFQWNAMGLTLKGAVPGTLFAAAVTLCCYAFVNQLGDISPLDPATLSYAALYLLLPIFLTLAVAFSTYLTVRHTLADMH